MTRSSPTAVRPSAAQLVIGDPKPPRGRQPQTLISPSSPSAKTRNRGAKAGFGISPPADPVRRSISTFTKRVSLTPTTPARGLATRTEWFMLTWTACLHRRLACPGRTSTAVEMRTSTTASGCVIWAAASWRTRCPRPERPQPRPLVRSERCSRRTTTRFRRALAAQRCRRRAQRGQRA